MQAFSTKMGEAPITWQCSFWSTLSSDRAKFPVTPGYSLAADFVIKMTLNAEQVLKLFVSAGRNLLITGQADNGKSRIVTSIWKIVNPESFKLPSRLFEQVCVQQYTCQKMALGSPSVTLDSPQNVTFPPVEGHDCVQIYQSEFRMKPDTSPCIVVLLRSSVINNWTNARQNIIYYLRWLNRVMQHYDARASDLNRKLIFLFCLLFS